MKTEDELGGGDRGDQPDQPANVNLQRGMELARDWRPPDKRITLTMFVAIVVLLGLSGGWPLLVVVFAIVAMICLHELGHYLTAKWSGMKVTEFFLGFGPKLWSTTRGETEYGIKAIPAGAYVRIIGMNNLEEVAPEDEPRTYRQQSYPKRLLVAVAGSGMHFILTLVCVFMLLTVTGAPGGHVFIKSANDWEIKEVVAGSAAASAGLQPGDRVVAIDGEPVTSMDRLREIVAARPGQTVTLKVERKGATFDTPASLQTVDGHGRLGVSSGFAGNTKVNVVTATGRTFKEFGAGVGGAVDAIRTLFSPSGIANFASQVRNAGSPAVDNQSGAPPANSNEPSADNDRPLSIIGAARIGSDLTANGLQGFLGFFATINLFIGIVNLIPLLPLDGGHVVIATYERIRSRKGKRYHVDVMKLLPLTYAVVMILALLFVSTVFLDLVDPIRLN